jgi:hypothetical protein
MSIIIQIAYEPKQRGVRVFYICRQYHLRGGVRYYFSISAILRRLKIWSCCKKSLLDSLPMELTKNNIHRLEEEPPSLWKNQINGRQIRNVLNVFIILQEF